MCTGCEGIGVFIGLQELQLHPVRFNVDIPAGEIDYEAKVSQASPLHAEGRAQLLNQSLGEIRVEGDLNVTMGAACDRCAEPAAFPVKTHFDLLYLPADSAEGEGEHEIESGSVDIGYYSGSGLVLNDLLRETVLLALPMQLVCSEDCKGICPVCGENRNQRLCDCHPEPVDDRWSKLRDFRAEAGPRN